VADPLTDRAGTGTHRQFSREEAIVACLVHGFALHQIAIGELMDISRAIRKSAKLGQSTPRGLWNLPIERAIKGDDIFTLVYESWRGGSTVSLFGGPPEFKHIRKPEGFAVVICLKTYLAGINELEQ